MSGDVDPQWKDAARRIVQARCTQKDYKFRMILEMWMKEFNHSTVFRNYVEQQLNKEGMTLEGI